MLVFANKQDLQTALPPDEIMTLLELQSITNKPWSIFACVALKGDGVKEGIEWMVNNMVKKE
jgi:signal recognition particle receptor subunit beta